MKKINMIMMGLMLGASSLYAQPGSVQKLAKSVFTLTTFNQKGDIIASTQGVFIDNKGTAISTFKPFVGAVKASVVDASGKSSPVEAIMGADELYDVAKFRINASTVAAPIATKESAAGDKVWLVPYSIKKPAYQQEDISSVEKFKTTYNYYIFSNSAPENAVGCPFANKNGQVIGLMHSNGQVTAIDANYAKQLKVTGLSSLDAALRETTIRTALPDTENEAMTMMTLKKGQTTAEEYAKYSDEFISKFPTSAFGYKEKATYLTDKAEYDAAAKLMEEGISKDEAIFRILKENIIASEPIRFEGDGYSEEWKQEAARRGLTNICHVPEALMHYMDNQSRAVLIGERIFNETELACRLEVELEKYTMKVQIESRVLGDLAINHIVPIAVSYQNRLLENLCRMKEIFPAEEYEIMSADRKELIKEISHRVSAIKVLVRDMTEARKVANHKENFKEKAFAYEETVRPYLESIRDHIDHLEMEIDDEIWPLPKYRELLFTK